MVNGTQFTIAILTSPREQAMIPQGSHFCMLLAVELLYPLTVKTILSVRCYEQQTAFPVKMAGRVKGTPANSLFWHSLQSYTFITF